MKKLITVIAFCATCYGAKAQATMLTVNSNSSCDVYYVIKGGPACGVGFSSAFTVKTAGSAPTIYTPASLGFPPGSTINAVDVYQSTSSCALFPNPKRIGESCSTLVNTATYNILMSNCGLCNPSITATWTRTVPPSTTATLSF